MYIRGVYKKLLSVAADINLIKGVWSREKESHLKAAYLVIYI